MKKIILNTINLKLGGAYQRCINFIENLERYDQFHFYILILNQLKSEIKPEIFKATNVSVITINHSHISKNKFLKISFQLYLEELKIKPDLIFSFVGPSYWRPFTKHLVGFGLPQLIYKDNPFVQKFDSKKRFKFFLKHVITKYEADFFVVQTDEVKEKMIENFKFSKKVYVVKNGVGQQFFKYKRLKNDKFIKRSLITITGYRPNKNLELIPKIISLLKKKEFKVRFELTLKDEVFTSLFDKSLINEWVFNRGKIAPKDIPKVYYENSALFLPSHLECFSASYCEAMYTSRPILTSNYSFATEVCNDSALYFDPKNPEDAADKIIQLFSNEEEFNDLCLKSNRRLEFFPSSIDQADSYIKIIQSLL